MSSAPAATTIPLAQPHDGSAHAEPAKTATIVIATLEPVRGETGVQTHSRTLHAGLTTAGQPCVLQTPLAHTRLWVPVFAVRPLLLKRVSPTLSTWWLRHWHEAALRGGIIDATRGRNVAAVVAQCPVSARAALDARERLGRDFAVAMVCHFNYSEATEYRDKGELKSQRYFDSILAQEKRVLESVDHVVYVSGWARRVVEDERGIRPRASSVIWNGVAPQPAPSGITRADIGLNPDDLVLISVGTLEPRKNQLALVKLFARVVRKHPAARLVLVGDGPARGAIESAIADLGLGDEVKLLGFRRDVAHLLPLADLYVHASLLENCPIVLLEAARAGLPVAAVPAGGVPELLAALGGSPLDLEDPDSIQTLLADPATRAHAGRAAHRAFEQNFTREAMVAAYARLLLPTAGAHPGGGGKT